MKELSSEILDMQPAIGLEKNGEFRKDFYFTRKLPEELEFLETLSWNYFWSWRPEGARLWRELDPALWEKCEQNPRLLLNKISGLRLWQKANDADYVEKLQRFSDEFQEYLAQTANTFGRITKENPAAYFCAEYGVHNS